MKDRRRQR